MPEPSDSLNAFLETAETPVFSPPAGPLAGLRLGVKDIFDVAGLRTGCGNPARLAEAAPAGQHAWAVRRLLDAGARFVGKTQTDELAFSLLGQNAHHSWPVNPRAPDRVTGGSSSGSAAAVAGGLAEVALGSDTGGSIRAPASFCGLIGLRTTHGRIPLDGVMPLAPSFDTVGWFAADIEAYEAVAKHLLGRDPHKAPLSRVVTVDALDELVAGPAEAAEYERMSALVDLPQYRARPRAVTSGVDELYWCFRQLQAHEAWLSHGDWIKAADRGLDPAVEARFGFGAAVEPRTVHAERVRRITFRAELEELLADGAVLMLPTVPSAAPFKDSSPDAFQAYRDQALRLLCWSGLSGFPQITLPLGIIDEAPFGLSLLGPPGSDIALVRLGRRVLANAGRN
jgi:amidase